MRFVRLLASPILPILAAGILAGCSDDSNPPSAPATKSPTTYDARFRGFFVASEALGQIDLTVSRPTPWALVGHLGRHTLAPEGSGTGATVPVSGTLSFYTQYVRPLSGTYDISTDEIQFNADGYEFQGHFDYSKTRLTGQITGTHTGVFDCAFDDFQIAIYCGTWGKTGAPNSGFIAFMTQANHLVGGMVTRPSLQKGYLVTGTIDDGDPLRAITAYGWNATDSLALGGYADTSVDTAGGWWESIPSDSGSGWWRASRYVPKTTADVTP